MAADNIREIFRTDTVGEFMDKCNWNFGIISRIGGPRGLQGERGETGARGRRGAMIHTVNEPDEMMDYMDVETASEILSTLDVEETENMEDGDVVFFKNGWVCEIGIEDGEIVAREPVFPIIGPQGPQGEQGESTDSLFTNLSGNALLLNHLSLTVGNRIYLPTTDSLNGGLYFAHMTDNGNNNITIDAEKAFINFNQNTLNINSNSGINIGTSSNSQINFSINNGDIMRVENDGLKLYKKVEFMGSTNIPGKITKSGNIITLYQDKTQFNKPIWSDSIISQYNQFRLNNSVVGAIGAYSNNGLLIYNQENAFVIGSQANAPYSSIVFSERNDNTINGLIFTSKDFSEFIYDWSLNNSNSTIIYQDKNQNYLNILKHNGSSLTNIITIQDNLTNFSTPVKGMVNGESVFLGVPAYTMMTYPDTLPAPQGWERFEDNLILFTDGTSHDTTSFNNNAYNDSDSNFYIYYNDGETIGYQRIIAVNTLPSNFDVQPSNSQKISYNSTPKNTVSSKESMSEVLNMSSKLNITENSFEAILTFANTNDKGTPGSGNTPSTIPVYENLLRKIFRNRTINTYEFGMGKIVSDNQFAFYFPMPVAPTGFTYIFKTA